MHRELRARRQERRSEQQNVLFSSADEMMRSLERLHQESRETRSLNPLKRAKAARGLHEARKEFESRRSKLEEAASGRYLHGADYKEAAKKHMRKARKLMRADDAVGRAARQASEALTIGRARSEATRSRGQDRTFVNTIGSAVWIAMRSLARDSRPVVEGLTRTLKEAARAADDGGDSNRLLQLIAIGENVEDLAVAKLRERVRATTGREASYLKGLPLADAVRQVSLAGHLETMELSQFSALAKRIQKVQSNVANQWAETNLRALQTEAAVMAEGVNDSRVMKQPGAAEDMRIGLASVRERLREVYAATQRVGIDTSTLSASRKLEQQLNAIEGDLNPRKFKRVRALAAKVVKSVKAAREWKKTIRQKLETLDSKALGWAVGTPAPATP